MFRKPVYWIFLKYGLENFGDQRQNDCKSRLVAGYLAKASDTVIE